LGGTVKGPRWPQAANNTQAAMLAHKPARATRAKLKNL
jgi:hypothetical protein